MSSPFLTRFAVDLKAIPSINPPTYDPSLEEQVGGISAELTGSLYTDARGDPTSDESTDR